MPGPVRRPVRLGVVVLALALSGCGDDDGGGGPAPEGPAAPTRSAPAAAPSPVQRPPALPPGSCCCDALARADVMTQVTSTEQCARLAGTCVETARCWVPNPPSLTPGR